MVASVTSESHATAVSQDERTEGGTAAMHDDAVGHYLEEIGSIPLLTAEEEITLARAIELGRLAAQRLEGPLSPENLELAQRQVREGEAARKRMTECNLRLVVSIARRYGDRGLPLSDLIQEGSIGLMRAVEKFDPQKGCRFSTYATWWIRQAVSRGLASQSRVVRLPLHVSDAMAVINRASQKLSLELLREPTVDEIAKETSLTAERIRELASAAQLYVSLEQPYGKDGVGTLEETLADDETALPVDQVLSDELREEVQDALCDLTQREQKVIWLRYGFNDGRQRTLREVGAVLRLTRERIRQIEHEALEKLRQSGRADALRALLG